MQKIKIGHLTDESIQRIQEIIIAKLKKTYRAFPIATKVWMAMHTQIPISFISTHWNEITEK
jgi:hypothetical protein